MDHNYDYSQAIIVVGGIAALCGPRSLRSSSCAYQKINVCWDLAQRFRINVVVLALQPLHCPHTSPIGSRKTLSFIIHVKRPIIGAKSKEENDDCKSCSSTQTKLYVLIVHHLVLRRTVRAVRALRDTENSNDARRQGLYAIKFLLDRTGHWMVLSIASRLDM
jgi:hypothetical protein